MKIRVRDLRPGDEFMMFGFTYEVCIIECGQLFYKPVGEGKGAVDTLGANSMQWVELIYHAGDFTTVGLTVEHNRKSGTVRKNYTMHFPNKSELANARIISMFVRRAKKLEHIEN